ncbi:type I polyketide synthase [Pseudofrankia inefficax]|uniref:Acyl transferase n=1 Tax=Pseudofrankia inefficax (strain DSM 45817 / CECT 9037 / DDB 130130 / EuI1c) TaxID=298654 RepID=E3JCX5_PSEI1|nr:type I polyketide synthase [Pseudofrankia inefficax]ADP81114.1 Acyl transferase [Pseudofrankia inefficax]
MTKADEGRTGITAPGDRRDAVLPGAPAAVVGVACRLPGAPDPAAFWRLLRSGTDAVRDDPARGRGGHLADPAGFDAEFFGISPREAAAIDPRQRLVLELAWEALEDAGVVPTRLAGAAAGVFIGAVSDDYANLLAGYGDGAVTRHTLTGVSRGLIANRVSYTLDLRGPSLTVDTAQSSSLVAVHLAVESLASGESEVALAGGVQLNLADTVTRGAERFGGLSPDGRCFTFDARANGYVRGEGGGVVVLKPLHRALADGDRIYCVVRGGAVNHDGGGGAGLTVPSADAQAEVIRQALARAGVEPGAVQYVELHGTGTKVGDPVEAAGLGRAVSGGRRPADALRVGSVKTNIGHLEGAAGIAGFLKTALAIRARELPPSLNFAQPNPAIELTGLGLRVQRELGGWPRPDEEPVAGVSSFGVGGTNCHLVLSAPPAGSVAETMPTGAGPAGPALAGVGAAGAGPAGPAPVERVPVVTGGVVAWPVSARSAPALRAAAANLRAAADADPALPLADVAWTLSQGRETFEHRAVVVGADRSELLAATAALAAGEQDAGLRLGVAHQPARAVFVLPGQGSQWAGMADALLDRSPVFADHVAACAEALAEHVEWRLLDVLRGRPGAPGLDRVDVVQPALFAMMTSLGALWRAAGVVPAAVVGHSQGEIAAAYLAGALSLTDAARLVARRSRALLRIAGRGGMASVALPADEVRDRLLELPGVAVAAVNGPAATVVAGEREALAEAVARLRASGADVRAIPVDYASHSPQVAELRAAVLAAAKGVAAGPASAAFYSTVTGDRLDPRRLDADYWYRNLREDVRFAPAIQAALADGHRVFVEISPHPVLTPGIRQIIEAVGADAVGVATLRRDDGGPDRFLTALGEAHTHGVEVDWAATLPPGRRRVDLPTYPFQRERYWLDDLSAREDEPDHPGPAASGPAAPPLTEPGQTTPLQTEPFPPMAVPASPVGREPAVAPAARYQGRDGERDLDRLVRSSLAAVLGRGRTAALDERRTFKDLGLDSLGAVEFRDRLASASGIPLPATVTFDHPTPAALLAYLRTADDDRPGGAATSAGPTDDPVVIVAAAGRWPGGADTPEKLWELLAAGQDAIGPFPTNRGWDLAALATADATGTAPSYVHEGGFLHDADAFDAELFGVNPREATAIDPQQRLLLESAWELCERAGIDPHALRGSQTGVFVGVMAQDYGPRMHEAPAEHSGYLLTGSTTSVASGRIAYVLGLAGPTLTIDTACSSSLVALHLASQALRAGECSLALAGGVTVMASPGIFTEFSRQRGLAPDGRCKPFAAAADGTAWGEAAGLVLLERLSDARRRGHPVLAVVRGSAVNSDGASNGLTAPNGPAQREVIRLALAQAGLGPADVDHVQAHGTGTELGDPIEAQALLATYGQDRADGPALLLGSVKSNLGHTQAAAGVTGVVAAVEAMRHGLIPATLHVDAPSPHVDWAAGAVRLVTEPTPWPETGRPRRAAVSSFGISGTNAHLILEQPPAVPEQAADGSNGDREPARNGPGDAEPVTTWVLSGHDPAALRESALRLRSAVAAAGPGLRPVDVGLTLATGRAGLDQRAAVIGSGAAELLAGLDALAAGEASPTTVSGTVAAGGRIAFVFPGQGSQWAGMARDLLDTSPVFAEHIERVAAALAPHVDWSLADVLRGRPSGDGTGPDWLERVDVVQPALFAVMTGLARLWESLGIRPDAVVGHSQAEIAAAYVAGILDLDDAARVVAVRSQIITRIAGLGGMASVPRPADAVQADLDAWPPGLAGLGIAAVNGPAATVVSGPADAVAALVERYNADGVRARRVPVDYASHSGAVEALADDLLASLADVRHAPARTSFYSTVTGARLDGTDTLSADYWYRNLRQPVRFADAVRALLTDGHTAFVEVSPHPVLTVGVSQTIEDEPDAPATVVTGTLRRGEDGWRRLHTALAQLHVAGHSPDWPAVFGPDARRVALPTYPFQRRRFWLDAPAEPGAELLAAGITPAAHPWLRLRTEQADTASTTLRGLVSLARTPWLADHAVAGTPLLPGTAFIDVALHAAAAGADGPVRLDELVLRAPLALGADRAAQLQVSVGPAGEDGAPVEIHARPAQSGTGPAGQRASWTHHASGHTGRPVGDGRAATAEIPAPRQAGEWPPSEWPPAGAEPVDVADLYRRLATAGYHYGPALRGLVGAWRVGQEVLAEARLPEPVESGADDHVLHPVLLDAVFQAALGLLDPDADPPGGPADGIRLRLPFSVSGVEVSRRGARTLRARIRPTGPDAVSVTAVDPSGGAVVTVARLVARPLPASEVAALRELAVRELALAGAASPRSTTAFRPHWPVLEPSATEPAGPSRWFLLGPDELGLADALAAGGGTPNTHPDLASAAAATGGQRPGDGTVVVLAVPAGGGTDPDRVEAAVTGTLATVQGFLADERLAVARLLVLTRGAMGVVDHDGPPDLGAAAVWGLVRSAQAEHPGRIVLVDLDGALDPATSPDPGRALRASVAALPAAVATGLGQLAARAGTVHVPRLAKAATGAGDELEIPAGAAWRLESTDPGAPGSLRLVDDPDSTRQPGPGEVQLQVRAAGVNFRDVLIDLGLYPGRARIGAEGSGVVTAVGPGVDRLSPGDRVMGLLPGQLGAHAVVDHRLLAPVPAGWDFARAAAVPVAYLTAYHGLVGLADLRPGETVLVHAAAGGVGQAAVALGRHLGAEVFGTASPDKWAAIRALGLDDDHLASSRDLSFAERFRVASGGGVRVVLNALAHEFTDASLGLLRPGGRFVELGKTDPRTPEELAARYPGRAYLPFDLLADVAPERIGAYWAELLPLLASGALPAAPPRSWDIRQAPTALRHLRHARHVGKVVLRLPRPLDPHGTVLITGGTGGLGALTARHLVAHHGVRHLLLVSRQGPDAPDAGPLAADLTAAGAAVTIHAADVADPGQLAATLARVEPGHPLTAVVHAAGALADATFTAVTPRHLHSALAPKAHAAWQLDRLTRDHDLSHFVLYSSTAAPLGHPGQAPYAAANAYLDALAQDRQRRGRPATSINWGPWQLPTGLTAHLSETDLARLARGGVLPLPTAAGLAELDAALAGAAPVAVAARLDTPAGRPALPEPLWDLIPVTPAGVNAPSPAGPAGAGDRPPAATAANGTALAERLRDRTAPEREALLMELVTTSAAAVLGHGPARALGPDRGFLDSGFDSLTSVEFRNVAAAATGLRLPTTLLFDHPTPRRLARHLAERLAPPEADPLAQVELLSAALARVATTAEPRVRDAVRPLLRQLLTVWDMDRRPAGPPDHDNAPRPHRPAADLESADDDELFAALDEELGLDPSDSPAGTPWGAR